MKAILFLLVTSVVCALPGVASLANDSAGAQSSGAVALMQLRESRRMRMANSPFKVPLIIESRQSADDIKGEVYAEINHTFKTVSAALGSPQV